MDLYLLARVFHKIYHIGRKAVVTEVEVNRMVDTADSTNFNKSIAKDMLQFLEMMLISRIPPSILASSLVLKIAFLHRQTLISLQTEEEDEVVVEVDSIQNMDVVLTVEEQVVVEDRIIRMAL